MPSKATQAYRKSLTPKQRKAFDKVQLDVAKSNVWYQKSVRLVDAKRGCNTHLIKLIEDTIKHWEENVEFYTPKQQPPKKINQPGQEILVVTLDKGQAKERTFSVACPLNLEAYLTHFLECGRLLSWYVYTTH